MKDYSDAMLGDEHEDVWGPVVSISDQIEACAGSRRFGHLSNTLRERHHYEAAVMVNDWVRTVSRGRYLSMVNVWADWALEEGTRMTRSAGHPAFLQAQDQFCLDYAAFLREFGL